MITTLNSSRNIDRSRLDVRSSSCAGASVHVGASAHGAFVVHAPRVAATTPANTMNLWLGDAQSTGFGSTYATKRIAPGRLEGMT